MLYTLPEKFMHNKFRRYLVTIKAPDDLQPKIIKPQSQRYNGPNVRLNGAYRAANITQLGTQQGSRANSLQNTYQQRQQAVPKTAPEYILAHGKHSLLTYEIDEIQKYQTVYYYGQKANKCYDPSAPNNGFDDKEGDYNPVVSDHIAYRYELLKLLGAGSFGKVYKAYDHKHGKLVALKLLKNRRKFRRQGLVEIRLLEQLRENDPSGNNHCIMLLNRGDFRGHLYIVMDMLHCDLYAHLADGGLKGLSMNDCKTLAVQLIQAMGYWQNLKIIHADIKPENVLLERSNSLDIRVIDFGSGATVGKTLYQYIQSRYYRAPEVILGYEYDYQIDTWSMACVFYELYTGQPVFSGDDEFDQLGKICELLGYPDPDYIKNAPRRNEFFWEAGANHYRLRTNHKVGTRSLKNEMKGADEGYIELIEQMLKWRPKERLTPVGARKLQFFTDVEWGPTDAPVPQHIQCPQTLPDLK